LNVDTAIVHDDHRAGRVFKMIPPVAGLGGMSLIMKVFATAIALRCRPPVARLGERWDV
jgi:hypothetical protein